MDRCWGTRRSRVIAAASLDSFSIYCGSAVCVHIFFFFFQAEDGIRDVAVTGVQTCALPISRVHDYNAEGWTNIGYGMELGRNELQQRGRREAVKMIVLMTDGKVNRPLDREDRKSVV